MNAKDFAKTLIPQTLKDIKVELDEEFDRNFQRKAFFSEAWAKRKYDDGKGSLLMRSGELRRSIHSRCGDNELIYTSSEVYAAIHNNGGSITVTAKMKKYFWAMYYKASDRVVYNVGSKATAKTKKNHELSTQAQFYKTMALKKVGSRIVIPKRQFIGENPQVYRIIREIAETNISEYLNKFIDTIKIGK